MNKAYPRELVDAFLEDKITKSEFIEGCENLGYSGKRAFKSAEALETKFKWKGITKLLPRKGK